jgi:DNA-binding transcriptional regulator LsrR (DeoR family)
MVFSARDLYGPDAADRAAEAVRRLSKRAPVPTQAVADEMGISYSAVNKRLTIAHDRGLVCLSGWPGRWAGV